MIHSLVPKSGLQHLRNQKRLIKEGLCIQVCLCQLYKRVTKRSFIVSLRSYRPLTFTLFCLLTLRSLTHHSSLSLTTHSLTHSLTPSLTQSLTHSLTPYSLRQPISATSNVITHENKLFQDRSAVCEWVCEWVSEWVSVWVMVCEWACGIELASTHIFIHSFSHPATHLHSLTHSLTHCGVEV